MESPTTETGEYLEAAAIAVIYYYYIYIICIIYILLIYIIIYYICYKWGLEPWTLIMQNNCRSLYLETNLPAPRLFLFRSIIVLMSQFQVFNIFCFCNIHWHLFFLWRFNIRNYLIWQQSFYFVYFLGWTSLISQRQAVKLFSQASVLSPLDSESWTWVWTTCMNQGWGFCQLQWTVHSVHWKQSGQIK